MPPTVTSLILATTVVATIAVGVASASFLNNASHVAASKSDRLPVAVAEDSATYLTFETRPDNGVSVLNRIQVN